jgi:hypothetical protein
MPFQEASLTEVGVLRDDGTIMLCGVVPNRRVSRFD